MNAEGPHLDLILLHVEADLEELVLPLLRELLALDATHADHADITGHPGLVLPDRLAELLQQSHYVVVLTSRRFPITPWPVLEPITGRRLLDHVVMVCHGVPRGALR